MKKVLIAALLITSCTPYIQAQTTDDSQFNINNQNEQNTIHKKSTPWAFILTTGALTGLYIYKTFRKILQHNNNQKNNKISDTPQVEEDPSLLRRGINWFTNKGKQKKDDSILEEE